MNLMVRNEDLLDPSEWTFEALDSMSLRDLREDFESIEWEKMHYDSIIHSARSHLLYPEEQLEKPSRQYLEAVRRSSCCQMILTSLKFVIELKEVKHDHS